MIELKEAFLRQLTVFEEMRSHLIQLPVHTTRHTTQSHHHQHASPINQPC